MARAVSIILALLFGVIVASIEFPTFGMIVFLIVVPVVFLVMLAGAVMDWMGV